MSAAKPARRKPGRPKDTDSADLRDRILDAAELEFAAHGYNGARLRQIAARAGVNPALIAYYNGSKAALFEEVIRRKGALIAAARQANLDALLARTSAPRVREIVRAYLEPQWDMKASGPGGAAFVRIQARLHAEPEARALNLRREIYDPTAKRYITVLAEALPHLTIEEVSLRMAFLVGTYLFMLNDLGRVGDLSDGRVPAMEKEDLLDHLQRFLAAGLRAD
ncbi:TetR family transcriptional regulator (plasmid) [Sagittula sp. P11]|uniref:TetR/AcrR family transcriptional regulator n=1 Tax=Sagittula sp. P11 TaxID=2009329 RepID=UPI000C2CEA4E|nr:TetR/AcrR family transcriptional regulator [Sagittula sp. P11]AUC56058.1 TetR family transcriptional regulator [Sagittula sp. P11]